MLIMWRGGLRIAEALALTRDDLNLSETPPTMRVNGKGRKTRLVPIHPELLTEFETAARYLSRRSYRAVSAVTDVGQVVLASRAQAHRWIKEAARLAALAGVFSQAKAGQVSSHTFRHSAARHWLANGALITEVQLWLGHEDLQTTAIYLKLVPDHVGRMEAIP